MEREQPPRFHGIILGKANPVMLGDMRQHHDALRQCQRRADAKARPDTEGDVTRISHQGHGLNRVDTRAGHRTRTMTVVRNASEMLKRAIPGWAAPKRAGSGGKVGCRRQSFNRRASAHSTCPALCVFALHGASVARAPRPVHRTMVRGRAGLKGPARVGLHRGRALLAQDFRRRRIATPYAGAGAPGTGSLAMRFTSL